MNKKIELELDEETICCFCTGTGDSRNSCYSFNFDERRRKCRACNGTGRLGPGKIIIKKEVK